MSTQRFDRGTLRKPARMANGWLKADGFLTRTGIFTYRNADGSERRELRLPEEVFHADALESFGLVPVTDDHPTEILDATNTKDHARGALSEGVRRDGEFVRATMLVYDASLIEKMEAGKVELSCGYTCDMDETPGTYRGQRYDAVQKNIRGNHVAVVDIGRAGPEARVRMDNASVMVAAVECSDEPERSVKGKTMPVIKHDGVEFETTEQVAQVWAKTQAELDATKKERDTLQARCDSANEELQAAKAKLVESEDPARVQALVAARVDLETRARKILGEGAKFDGKSDDEIVRAALSKAKPKLDMEGKSKDYLTARFDDCVEAATETLAPANTERNDSTPAPQGELAKRAALIEYNRNRWKTPAGGAKKG